MTEPPSALLSVPAAVRMNVDSLRPAGVRDVTTIAELHCVDAAARKHRRRYLVQGGPLDTRESEPDDRFDAHNERTPELRQWTDQLFDGEQHPPPMRDEEGHKPLPNAVDSRHLGRRVFGRGHGSPP